MKRASRPTEVAFILGAFTLTAAAASCSLGLDESLIDKAKDGGLNALDGNLPDGASLDGAIDTGIPSGPDASACTNDDACTTNHGCLKGKCDLTRKSCTYDVCRPAACTAAACDVNARTCGAGAAYKYKASQFNMGVQTSCIRCAAAIHPWLFVVTATGVIAFNVSNPANPSPPQVPVVGLGFVPGALIPSGSRVWMTGGMNGAGPSRLQLAYIDAPADPFTTKIVAHTVLATYNRPAEGVSLFPRGGDSALLVGPPAAQFPSAVAEAPLNEPAALTATPLVFALNTGPNAVTGKRLLMSGITGGVAAFNLIDNAGAANPTSGPVTSLTDAGQVSNQRTFAQSPDGAIFWATGVHQAVGLETFTRAVRGYFLVPNETGPIESNVGVDVEIYNVDPVGANAAVFGPGWSAAMLDSKTVMIATQARENNAQTAVQFVKREPLGVLKEANNMTPRRQVLPVPIGAIATATASNGVGYLVANDVGGPAPSGTVYVFDPGCAP